MLSHKIQMAVARTPAAHPWKLSVPLPLLRQPRRSEEGALAAVGMWAEQDLAKHNSDVNTFQV